MTASVEIFDKNLQVITEAKPHEEGKYIIDQGEADRLELSWSGRVRGANYSVTEIIVTRNLSTSVYTIFNINGEDFTGYHQLNGFETVKRLNDSHTIIGRFNKKRLARVTHLSSNTGPIV